MDDGAVRRAKLDEGGGGFLCLAQIIETIRTSLEIAAVVGKEGQESKKIR
jgi:hypothetical protein